MDQIVALVTAHHYLALSILLLGYLLRIAQPDSKIPITIPARYQPAVLLSMGQAYACLIAIQGGTAWPEAIEHGLTASLIVVVLRALFVPEPAWLKTLAFVLNTPTDPPPVQLPPAPPPANDPPPPPAASKRWAIIPAFALLLGCAAVTPVIPAIVTDTGNTIACVISEEDATPPPAPAQVALDCGEKTLAELMQILTQVLSAEQAKPVPNKLYVAKLQQLHDKYLTVYVNSQGKK